jgi:O-antigen ligase
VHRHLELWAVAATVAIDHPLFGTGPETFPEVFPRYARQVLGRKRADSFTNVRVESPHNVYLAIAAGAGLPALALYVAIIVLAAVSMGRSVVAMDGGWTRVALAAMLAAVGGHVVTDMFMTADVTSSWLFWVVMGAGVRVARTFAQSPP